MKLFLDTANVEEIREGAALGVISGVTTNPSLAAKERIGDVESYKAAILNITKILPNGSISVEVTALNVDGMIRQGEDIATWHPNVVVKLPSTVEGFKAMAAMRRQKIPVNQTLCFSVNQALLGAELGVKFVSPFVGRLDDEGQDGMQVVADIVEVYNKQNVKTEVLAASIRHPLHMVQAAKAGAHVATLPYKILLQMTQHSLTDVGMAKFSQDWQKVSGVRK